MEEQRKETWKRFKKQRRTFQGSSDVNVAYTPHGKDKYDTVFKAQTAYFQTTSFRLA